jgi:hypothetical protein
MFSSKGHAHEFGFVDGTGLGCSGLGKLARPVVPRELTIAVNLSKDLDRYLRDVRRLLLRKSTST